jgi:hypothetical protein
MMTEIREPNFSIDLPGDWESEPGEEESTTVFNDLAGSGKLSVMLLGVRPMFAIADQRRLLEDYVTHRSTFEMQPPSTLRLLQPELGEAGEAQVATWDGVDDSNGRHVRHYTLLVGGLLADFTYEATGVTHDEFDKTAEGILNTVSVTI